MDNSRLPQISINGVQYSITNVPGDGNCFFHCLSLALFGDISKSLFLRENACEQIISNWRDRQEELGLNHGQSFSTSDAYKSKMINNNLWATASEVKAVTDAFAVNFTIFTEGKKYDNYGKTYKRSFTETQIKSNEKNVNKEIKLLLCRGHYTLLTENDKQAKQTRSRNTFPNKNEGMYPQNESKQYTSVTVQTRTYSDVVRGTVQTERSYAKEKNIPTTVQTLTNSDVAQDNMQTEKSYGKKNKKLSTAQTLTNSDVVWSNLRTEHSYAKKKKVFYTNPDAKQNKIQTEHSYAKKKKVLSTAQTLTYSDVVRGNIQTEHSYEKKKKALSTAQTLTYSDVVRCSIQTEHLCAKKKKTHTEHSYAKNKKTQTEHSCAKKKKTQTEHSCAKNKKTQTEHSCAKKKKTQTEHSCAKKTLSIAQTPTYSDVVQMEHSYAENAKNTSTTVQTFTNSDEEHVQLEHSKAMDKDEMQMYSRKRTYLNASKGMEREMNTKESTVKIHYTSNNYAPHVYSSTNQTHPSHFSFSENNEQPHVQSANDANIQSLHSPIGCDLNEISHDTEQDRNENDISDTDSETTFRTFPANMSDIDKVDFLKCRKLGLVFEASEGTNETNTTTKNRRLRNRRKIAKKESLLGVKAANLPDPPPLSEDNQFNKAMDAIRAFEISQMNYKFKSCEICHETRLEPVMKTNNVCLRCSKDHNPTKMFSHENNMNPGEIPNELKDMSVVEQQLICRLSPAIHVHMLGHGGIAANGHCVTFPQNVNEPARILPKLPSEIDVIRVTRQGKDNKSKDFRCRRHKIQNALEWLKQHNPAYSDIIISQTNLSVLPIDDELNINCLNVDSEVMNEGSDKGPAPQQTCINETDAGVSDSGVLLNDPPINIQKEISKAIEDLVGNDNEDHTVDINHKKKEAKIPWPTRANEPISEFTTRNFFTLSFPTLFPYQHGDFHINRPRTCTSMSDWADHLMWYKDGRFAKHQYFKFIVHNMIMRKRALELSSFIVKQKLGEQHYSIEEIRGKIREGDTTIADKLLYFSASLRGTSQYWNQRSKELRSMVQYQINEGNGLPSFFTTGSCAEYHFKPLRRLLQNYIELTTNTRPDLNDRSIMFNVLQQHTHIIAKYFDLRTQAYFKEVMEPVFGVNAYWYRQEFAKSRGMIHWHGLCWRSDKEPHVLLSDVMSVGLNPEDRAKRLSDWALTELGMTALHPAGKNVDGESLKEFWPPPEGTAPTPPEDKNPLIKLLMDVSQSQDSLLEDHLLLTNRINIHRCSDYCLRLPRHSRSGEKTCRMEFGSEKNPGKEIRNTPSIVRDRNRNERLEMPRDHPFLVQHSKYHTQGWRANGDISIILSKNGPNNPSVEEIIATENYITGYACKGNEGTSALVDLFNDTIHSSENSTIKSICTSLLMNTIKRDVSSTEASFELSSIPLYRSSHQFQSVSITGARMLERNGFTLTKQTPLDKYLQRKQDDESSFYQFICKSGKVPVVSGGPVYPTWPLKEDYSRTILLMHWPNWRKISDIVGENDKHSWVESLQKFLVTDRCPNFIKAEIERAKFKIFNDQIEECAEDSEKNRDEGQPEWMDLIAPDGITVSEVEGNELDFDDGGPCHDWSKMSLPYPENAVNFLNSVAKNIFDEDTLDIPDVDIDHLNPEQKFAFKIVMENLNLYVNNNSSYQPLRMIIGGTAGTGKSFLIKCLIKGIRGLFKTNKSVQVLCPTGSSANLISGVTIHSFLKVPTTSKNELTAPSGANAEQLQRNCEGVKVLIVDERSLVGCNTLGWMEHMARFGINHGEKNTESWGGLPAVIFLGDDVQLPPVCDCPVYKNPTGKPAALHGFLVWKEFQTVVFLSKIVRQDDSQTYFKDTLMSLRDYSMTPIQAQWLQQFQWEDLQRKYGQDFLARLNTEGLFVFPTHELEWEHNKNQILEANKCHPIAKIEAENHGIHAKGSPSDTAGGLLPSLFICQSAKVMLTSNLDVRNGLFNGSVGEVVDIIYDTNQKPPSLPKVVFVKFDKYKGQAVLSSHPKVVPITPIERRIDCRCHNCKRRQIPLRLGWGTTIHRCQGMTIGEGEPYRFVVIHPGSISFESRNPGALFVALSRAKTAGDALTYPDFAFHSNVILNTDRLLHKVKTPTTVARRCEINRLIDVSSETRQKYHHLISEE